ncbi:MAG: hypothetical protein ABSA15_04235 [Thermoplasmata archaeon]|jgi:hypothetical protein
MTAQSPSNERSIPVTLTNGSHVRIRSAGPKEEALESVGVFRGLVSIGGDSSLAIELGGSGEEKGRIRLIPLAALYAIDILEAAKADEEKRSDKSPAPGYFR